MLNRRALIYGMSAGLIALLQRGVARARPADGELFRSFRCDLTQHRLGLHWQRANGRAYQSLRALKRELEKDGKTVLALTNAGIYSTAYAPLGLHVEESRQLVKLNRNKGGGNFFLQPNGVFYVANGKPGIMRTSEFASAALADKVSLATQSGPLLFDHKGIHPRFLPRSTSTYIRNAVGFGQDGDIVLAISNRPVTLHRLALFMRDEMKCSAGLYLDGSISAFWQQGEPLPFAPAPFVGMLAVTQKAALKQPT